MATTVTPTTPKLHSDERQLLIVSHSMLFYWWPIWALGVFLAIWTYVEGHRLAILPPDTQVTKIGDEKTDKGELRVYHVTVPVPAHVAKDQEPTKALNNAVNRKEGEPTFRTRVSQQSWMGATFCIFLVLVIFITSVPLRGLWSVIALISIALITVILAFFELWDKIFEQIAHLNIYINMAGYLFIATVLFIMWAVTTVVFDQQVYMVFTPGQLRVCTEIGGGETVYDTMGLVTEKHRDDLFRHWVLGLGSGDLTVRTAGAQAHTFTMPNVLFIGAKLKQIQEMMRDKPVVSGQP
jgi:hypothetical protein